MKTLITVTILLLANQLAVAQKNFEGKIIYQYNELTNSKKGSIEAFFSNKKIKAYIRDSSEAATNNTILIDLENGILYYSNAATRKYKKENITDKHSGLMLPVLPNPQKNKTILGFSCTAYSSNDSSLNEYPVPSIVTAWIADSLYFHFDKKYATSEMTPMFGNGEKIALGFEMKMRPTSTNPILIKAVPVLIEQHQLHDSVFAIPPDYTTETHEENYNDSAAATDDSTVLAAQAAVDSVVRIIDSIMNETNKKAKKKTKSQKSPSKNTHTQPTKSPAIKPKQ